jgi:monofunctional biosynthetic peptidoglycan transglycosylase
MKLIKKIFKIIFWLIISFFIYSILIVVVYKWIPPPFTPFILIRVAEGLIDGSPVGIDKTWESYNDISPNVFRAVISGEDARFMKHNGIDWKAVQGAESYNKLHKGSRLHGASTISMQTAKNAFLWQGRNYIRKGLEVYFTYLIEAIWGKKRIIEVYVNIVELGKGIYGVEAASQEYFHKPAKDLTRREAALLAAILPNPRRWSPAHPSSYVEQRVKFIQGRMNSVAIPK